MTNTTWNSADSSKNITLSALNLAAAASASGDRGIRGVHGQTSGKYYFEVTVNVRTGADTGWGIVDNKSDLNFIGSSAFGAALCFNNGVFIENSNRFTLGTLSAADVVSVALDIDNRRIWFRKNGGNWNADVTKDPTVPSSGFDLGAASTAQMGAVFFPAAALGTSGDKGTANFGDSAFSFAVPSGYTSGWPTSPYTFPPTWDFYNTSASMTLSGGNLTATCTVVNSGTTAQVFRSTGKYYIEMSDVVDTGAAYQFGLGTQALNYGIPATNTNGISYIATSGIVKFNNATQKTISTYTAGDVIGIAIDLDNAKIWWRKNAGGWDNDILANQNPATNTGGTSISTMPLPVAPYFIGGANLDKAVANFGASAFTQTAPSGFVALTGLGASGVTRATAANLQAMESGAPSNTRATAASLEVLRNTPQANTNARATGADLQVLRTVGFVTSTLATAVNLQVLVPNKPSTGTVYTWEWP